MAFNNPPFPAASQPGNCSQEPAPQICSRGAAVDGSQRRGEQSPRGAGRVGETVGTDDPSVLLSCWEPRVQFKAAPCPSPFVCCSCFR